MRRKGGVEPEELFLRYGGLFLRYGGMTLMIVTATISKQRHILSFGFAVLCFSN